MPESAHEHQHGLPVANVESLSHFDRSRIVTYLCDVNCCHAVGNISRGLIQVVGLTPYDRLAKARFLVTRCATAGGVEFIAMDIEDPVTAMLCEKRKVVRSARLWEAQGGFVL